MSKLKANSINFNDDDFIIELKEETKPIEIPDNIVDKEPEDTKEDIIAQELLQAQEEKERILAQAKKSAEGLIESSKNEAQKVKEEIIEKAKIEADEIINEANEKAKQSLENAKKESEDLVEASKAEIEDQRAKSAREGYNDGYEDAKIQFHKEMEEKVEAFNEFCSKECDIRDKILKNASGDILNIISNISKKVLLEDFDADKLDKIIKHTVNLFEKKENITLILSEKYARFLYELQKKNLGGDIELNFDDFKQYQNFEVIYNPKYDDDTIIVENLKERFDASLKSQLDVIIRDIFDNAQNGNIDLGDYTEDEA